MFCFRYAYDCITYAAVDGESLVAESTGAMAAIIPTAENMPGDAIIFAASRIYGGTEGGKGEGKRRGS